MNYRIAKKIIFGRSTLHKKYRSEKPLLYRNKDGKFTCDELNNPRVKKALKVYLNHIPILKRIINHERSINYTQRSKV